MREMSGTKRGKRKLINNVSHFGNKIIFNNNAPFTAKASQRKWIRNCVPLFAHICKTRTVEDNSI